MTVSIIGKAVSLLNALAFGNVTGLTANSIPYANSSGLTQDNANLSYDGSILTAKAGKRDKVRVVVAAGAVTVGTDDYIVVVNKTVGAATTVNLPAGVTGQVFIIKDGKGDAGTNNITIDGNAAETIDGTATKVISTNYNSAMIVWNGTEWNVI